MRITVARQALIPDKLKLERYRRTPELGPRLLFFSGGTALRDASKVLIRYTYNSIHVITPFDSGGSSAVLRKAFAMPAVGDIRNRLMALADQSVTGNPEIVALFSHRLPRNMGQERLRRELETMAQGRHKLVARVHDPMRKIIRNHLRVFMEAMPEDFDLKGASIGNLVLTAGYLSNRRQLDPMIYLFTKLAQVCGVVRPVVTNNLHLAVRLAEGDEIVGQHNFTGKQTGPIKSAIEDIWLVAGEDDPEPAQVSIRGKMKDRIAEAELICYPLGSFFSSLVANLLPGGVGRAVAANACPKVFTPNPVGDPELKGLSVRDQVLRLHRILARDFREDRELTDFLQYLVVDSRSLRYPGGNDFSWAQDLGLTVIDTPLARERKAGTVDAEHYVGVLLSLV